MQSKYLLILAVLVSTLFGCSELPFYEKSFSFKNSTWKLEDKPVFEVDIEDTVTAYDFILTIRNTTDYKYNNLWFFWESKTPDGQTVREPIEVKITNPDGTWIGINSGTVVENNIHFKRRVFPASGHYTFTLEEAITEAEVKHLLDVSLRIEKAK